VDGDTVSFRQISPRRLDAQTVTRIRPGEDKFDNPIGIGAPNWISLTRIKSQRINNLDNIGRTANFFGKFFENIVAMMVAGQTDLLSFRIGVILGNTGQNRRFLLGELEARSLVRVVAGDRFILSSAVRRVISHHLLAKYLNQLGYQHYLDGEFQSARSALTDAVRYNPNLAPAHYNLGSTDECLQQFASARNHYEIAAEGEGRAAHAAVSNLARLALLDGDAEAAIASIQKILDRVSDPGVKVALNKNLGWAYFLKNDPDRAERHLRNALDISHKNSAVFYLLAQVLELQGERQQALTFWEGGLAADDRDRAPSATPWRQPELEGWRAIARQRVNAGTPQKA